MLFRRSIAAAFSFPDWVFGRKAAGIDLGFAALAAGWLVLMLTRPALFDRGSFVGMDWLSDESWEAFLCAVLLAHCAGLACPGWKIVRVPAALLSAWFWILVAISLYRVEMNTGVLVYGIAGVAALIGALHVAGLPREQR